MKITAISRHEPVEVSLVDSKIGELYWTPDLHSSTAIVKLGPTDGSSVAYRVMLYYLDQSVTSVFLKAQAGKFMVTEFSENDSITIGR